MKETSLIKILQKKKSDLLLNVEEYLKARLLSHSSDFLDSPWCCITQTLSKNYSGKKIVVKDRKKTPCIKLSIGDFTVHLDSDGYLADSCSLGDKKEIIERARKAIFKKKRVSRTD